MAIGSRDVLVSLLFLFYVVSFFLTNLVAKTDPMLSLYALMYLIAFVIYIGFWLWMLASCIRRKGLKQKWLWVILFIFLSVITAIVYYFYVHRKGEEFVETASTTEKKKWHQRPLTLILVVFLILPIVLVALIAILAPIMMMNAPQDPYYFHTTNFSIWPTSSIRGTTVDLNPVQGQKDFAKIVIQNNSNWHITEVDCDNVPPEGAFAGNTDETLDCKTSYVVDEYFVLTADALAEPGEYAANTSSITIDYTDSYGNRESAKIYYEGPITISES